MENQSFTYDRADGLSANTFTRLNYSFSGWNRASDGSGAFYTDGQSIINLTDKNEVVNLYAQWSPNFPTDAIPGSFTVDEEGTVVYFAKGNTYTNGSVYGFEDNQYDYRTVNGNATVSGGVYTSNGTASGDKGLFSWEEGHAVEKAGWTLLTDKQWNYILNERENAGSKKGVASINTGSVEVKGFVILPDVFDKTFTFGKTYTLTEWAEMQEDGAVFFPGTGYYDTSMSTYSLATSNTTYLTSSTSFRTNGAYALRFDGSALISTIPSSGVAVSIYIGSYFPMRMVSSPTNVNNYTVTFDVNGGDALSDSEITKTVTYGSTYGSLPTAYKTGYTFNGWFTAGSSKITSDTTVTIRSSQTLYAHWTANTYKISFNGNNASSGSMADMDMTYDVSKKLTKNVFARTGYTFIGWSDASDGDKSYDNEQSVRNLATSGTKTLYAVWTANKYTIKFNVNTTATVTGSMADMSMTYDNSSNLTKNAFVRTGYTFIGWTEKADGTGKSYSDGSLVTNLTEENGKEVTLYAQWNPITYYVKFNSNSGTGIMANQSFRYDEAEKELKANEFSKTGYEFGGWAETSTGSKKYDDKAKVQNLGSTEGKTVELFAVWTKVKYTITYDLADDTADPATHTNPTSYYVDSTEIKLAAASRTGYTFTGWTISPLHAPIEKISTGTTGNMNLTAHWNINSYSLTVSYEDTGISEVTSSVSGTLNYRTSVTVKATVKDGYDFTEWASSVSTFSLDKKAEVTFSMPASDIKLTAKAGPHGYKVTYDLAGGSVSTANPTTYNIESADITLNNPSRTGYTFTGWTGSNGTTPQTSVKITKG